MKKMKSALLAMTVAALLGAGAAPAAAVTPYDGHCPKGADCDSHWMAPGDPD
ncbi:hypothetical protein [Streptosporangium lutulentum]|uniref:Opacity protein-like surface antigen n=1 Tax=Streptosporangium lutulentum TaxID=1461250 RepID=A0ABT9QST6_9ACTN|nr:hypothetical protein [Streptosporangium lutulentum]MDP9849809.1 opacity protein-like surface antigen [Streptosporangium lutulentum]